MGKIRVTEVLRKIITENSGVKDTYVSELIQENLEEFRIFLKLYITENFKNFYDEDPDLTKENIKVFTEGAVVMFGTNLANLTQGE
jgi:hypothetical protein